MARTRLIRPEFFTDELMAAISIPARLVYIGLWTLCDDDGYFESKPRSGAMTGCASSTVASMAWSRPSPTTGSRAESSSPRSASGMSVGAT